MLTRAQKRVKDSLDRVRDGVERFSSSSDGQASQSGNGTQDRTSSSNDNRPPSVINISDNVSYQDQRSVSSASRISHQSSHQSYIDNALSIATSVSTISHPSQFSREFRRELIEYYTDRFINIYGLLPTSREVLRLADLLKTVYSQNYHKGEDEVDLAMHTVYVQYSEDMEARMDFHLNNNENYRIRGGADAASVGNNRSDASASAVEEVQEVPPPQNVNARENRARQREERRQQQVVNPDGDDNGDGSSSDNSSDDSDYVPPGAPQDDRREVQRQGRDGGPPPDDDGDDDGDDDDDEDDEDSDDDEEPVGHYMRRPLIIPANSGIRDTDIDLVDEVRKIRRAFYLCNIADRYHAALLVLGGLLTFDIICYYTYSVIIKSILKMLKIFPFLILFYF